MKLIKIIILSIILTAQALAQQGNFISEELNINPLIEGTLLHPDDNSQVPLLIMIQGSGPTDRDGNQSNLKNNSLLMFAESLSEAGIATYRYDKRIFPMLREGKLNEAELSFDDFVADAQTVLTYFQDTKAYSRIYIAGHSQGSLVAMMAAQQGADGYISLAGAGQTIDEVIIDQLENQAPAWGESAKQAFEDMKTKGVAENFNPAIASLFRKELQPFMLSWMKYDPAVEIAKLSCPVLIINGDKDIQVAVSEAEILAKAKPDARYEVITNMNHILKTIEGEILENMQSYNDPEKPLSTELTAIIVDFVKK